MTKLDLSKFKLSSWFDEFVSPHTIHRYFAAQYPKLITYIESDTGYTAYQGMNTGTRNWVNSAYIFTDNKNMFYFNGAEYDDSINIGFLEANINGTGMGSKIINSLKSYALVNNKKLQSANVTNFNFFKKMGFKEITKNHYVFNENIKSFCVIISEAQMKRLLQEYDNSKDREVIKDIFSRVSKSEWQEWSATNEYVSGVEMDQLDQDEQWDEVEYFLESEKEIYVTNGIVSFDILYDGVDTLIGDNPIQLYHYTSDKFIEDIKTDGLVVGKAITNPHGNSSSGIYLTTEGGGNVVDGYKQNARKHGGGVAVITVKTYLDNLSPDPDDQDLNVGEKQFIVSHISPNNILNIEETY